MPDPAAGPAAPEPSHPALPPALAGGALAWAAARRFLLKASVAGVLASIGVHILAWVVTLLVRVPLSNADAGGVADAPIEFAVMSRVELSAPPDAASAAPPAAGEALEAREQPVESLTDLVGSDLESLVDQPVELRVDTLADAASGPGAAMDTSGFGAAGSGAGASFFGLEAQGRRFIYIIDVSGSMDGDAFDGLTRMQVTKRELARSLTGLLETSEFSVLLFAADSGALYPRAWVPATERNKIDARSRVGRLSTDDVIQYGVRSTGGTDPRRAFEQAFRIRPLADAIYFMTDGEFDSSIPDFIDNLNRRARLPIHCILFIDPESNVRQASEPRLREIAARSGGRYTLVGGS